MLSIIVGRLQECDIVIDDPYISPRHCRITQETDGYWVEDLGSTNGTRLRPAGASLLMPGLRVYGKSKIPAGWRVWVGRTELPWNS